MEPTVVVKVSKEYLLAFHVWGLHCLIGTVYDYLELMIFAVKFEIFYYAVVGNLIREVEVTAAEKRFVFAQPDKPLDHVYAVCELP